MPYKRQITNKEGVYFITFTCFRWKTLISITNSYDLFCDWFDILKLHGHLIIAFQIMPNHMHCIIAFRHSQTTINIIVGNGKRFIAYGIVARLQALGYSNMLEEMALALRKSDRKKGQLHKVWESSFEWKECYSRAFLLQKLNYMHNNACKGKWQLAKSPEEYVHSSARYYITGEHGIYPVTSYMELEDIDLTKSARSTIPDS